MDIETLFNGSSLNQLEVIIDIRDSLQLSYPELESVASQYGINDPRIFPYLGTDPSPPVVENYSSKVLEILGTPIREDYVRIAFNILATPIRDDYLRLALNTLATPIRDDYLRLAMNNITRSIREDHLRLVMEAMMRAIREDCLRTALEKFNDKGIDVKPTVTQVTGVIQNNSEFIKYSPVSRLDLTGEERIRYIELKEMGQDLGEMVTVLDRKMYEIPVKSMGLDASDYNLYTNGSIGLDGYYEDMKFVLDSVEHIYLPVFCKYSPTKEKAPKDYWINQARCILDEEGWSKENIREISRDTFRPFKGKKPSSKVMSSLRYTLMREIERKKLAESLH
jgi:hypothetical protein